MRFGNSEPKASEVLGQGLNVVMYYLLAIVTTALIGSALLTLVGGFGALWIGLAQVAVHAFTLSEYLVTGAAVFGGGLILFTQSRQ